MFPATHEELSYLKVYCDRLSFLRPTGSSNCLVLFTRAETFKCGSWFIFQLVAFGSGCVNGKWDEDTCVCNEGYETVPSITTEPSYCTKRSVVVIHIVNTSPWNHRDVLDITLPIVSFL